MSKMENNPSHKISPALVIRHFRRVTAKEGIAKRAQGGIRVRRHITRVSAERDMLAQFVLYSPAQAIGKIRPIRGLIVVGLMRKTQAAGNVRPPLVLAAHHHVQRPELVLIDSRVESLYVGRARELQIAVGGWVSIPHKIELRVLGN